MKTVYEYDSSKKLIHRKIVSDDYTLTANETLVATPDDQYPPYLFDEASHSWSGLTLDQYKQVNSLGQDGGEK